MKRNKIRVSKDGEIQLSSKEIYTDVAKIIKSAKNRTAIFLNRETTLMYWNIGTRINRDFKTNNRTTYGKKILVTLSQELTDNFGKGFSYTALTRMCRVATFVNEKNIATLSQELSWVAVLHLLKGKSV